MKRPHQKGGGGRHIDPEDHVQLLATMYPSPSAIEAELHRAQQAEAAKNGWTLYGASPDTPERVPFGGGNHHWNGSAVNRATPRERLMSSHEAPQTPYVRAMSLQDSNRSRRAKSDDVIIDPDDERNQILHPDDFMHPSACLHSVYRPDTILDLAGMRAARKQDQKMKRKEEEEKVKALLEAEEELDEQIDAELDAELNDGHQQPRATEPHMTTTRTSARSSTPTSATSSRSASAHPPTSNGATVNGNVPPNISPSRPLSLNTVASPSSSSSVSRPSSSVSRSSLLHSSPSPSSSAYVGTVPSSSRLLNKLSLQQLQQLSKLPYLHDGSVLLNGSGASLSLPSQPVPPATARRSARRRRADTNASSGSMSVAELASPPTPRIPASALPPTPPTFGDTYSPFNFAVAGVSPLYFTQLPPQPLYPSPPVSARLHHQSITGGATSRRHLSVSPPSSARTLHRSDLDLTSPPPTHPYSHSHHRNPSHLRQQSRMSDEGEAATLRRELHALQERLDVERKSSVQLQMQLTELQQQLEEARSAKMEDLQLKDNEGAITLTASDATTTDATSSSTTERSTQLAVDSEATNKDTMETATQTESSTAIDQPIPLFSKAMPIDRRRSMGSLPVRSTSMPMNDPDPSISLMIRSLARQNLVLKTRRRTLSIDRTTELQHELKRLSIDQTSNAELEQKGPTAAQAKENGVEKEQVPKKENEQTDARSNTVSLPADNVDELKRRQSALNQREAELDAREAEIARKMKELEELRSHIHHDRQSQAEREPAVSTTTKGASSTTLPSTNGVPASQHPMTVEPSTENAEGKTSVVDSSRLRAQLHSDLQRDLDRIRRESEAKLAGELEHRRKEFEKECERQLQALAVEHHQFVSNEREQLKRARREFEEMKQTWLREHTTEQEKTVEAKVET